MNRAHRVLGLISALTAFAPTAFAVINGEAANDARYAAVGSIWVRGKLTCTATLVSSKWIVTAEHCTGQAEESDEEGGGKLLPPSAYEFRLGIDSKNPEFKIKLKRWVSAPEISVAVEGEAVSQQLDLAFGELTKDAPLEKLKTRAIRPLSQSWTPGDLAADYTHISYGARQPFGESKSPLNGKRQLARFKATSASGNALLNLYGDVAALEAAIHAYHSKEIDLELEEIDRILKNGELIENYNVHVWDPRGRSDLSHVTKPEAGWQDTCFGDSGGPLFRESDGEVRIVGVASHGMNGTCASLGTVFTTFGPKIQDLMKELGI